MKAFTRDTSTSAWVERAVELDSVRVSDTVNERSTAELVINDPTGVEHFPRGTGLQITSDADEVLFVGFVMESNERRLGLGGDRTHDIKAVDLHYLLDKRVVAAAYQNQTAGEIVRDLVLARAGAEGLAEGTIQAGPIVRAVTFQYRTVADAIGELAERAGFWWRVRPTGLVDFARPVDLLTVFAGSESEQAGSTASLAGAAEGTSNGAGLVDLADAALADRVSVVRHAPSFRTRQWIRGGRDRTVPQLEVQSGDGTRRTFLVGFPVAEEPTIEVRRSGGAWAPQLVGVAGLQGDRPWVYAYGSTSITQGATETVLASADQMRITYVGLFDVVARVDDSPLQIVTAAVEGGSGLVEHVLTDASSTSRDAALQLAGELLAYHGRHAVTVRFATRNTTLEPGQLATLEYAGAGLVGAEALVTTVERFTRGGVPESIVTLVIGPLAGSWAQWLGALSRRIDRLSDPRGGEVEVVTTLAEFGKTWTEAERPNIFTYPLPGAELLPGATLVPAFTPERRVLYLAWYVAGSEIGRKAITQQTTSTAEGLEVTTTVVLTATDAVGAIEEFGWWGGDTATVALGSGVEVDRQAFVMTKTDIEQIVVVKTDERWS